MQYTYRVLELWRHWLAVVISDVQNLAIRLLQQQAHCELGFQSVASEAFFMYM